MIKSLISPSKYIQGPNIWNNFSEYVFGLGDKFFIISTKSVMPEVKKIIGEDLKSRALKCNVERFGGECSKAEINRLRELVKSNNSNVVIGVGGGKVSDIAKAVAYYENTPLVIVPTIASTDAPTSAVSVIYDENGFFEDYLFLPSNPDMVIVDSTIISKAPPKFLIAGIGDAVATYFETRACKRADATSMAGGKIPLAAMALSELCYKIVLENGFKALQAVKNGVNTKAVEDVIEANIYLSGIGFESGGLAAAHAIHNGLMEIEELHGLYHGEKVAFGTLVQLILENADLEEIESLLKFYKSVGLPTTFSDMGIKNIDKEAVMRVAKKSCEEGETIYNMPFVVTPESVYAAIIAADELGEQYK